MKKRKNATRQGTNRERKTERKRKKDIGEPSQRNEREAKGVVEEKGGWMREKDREGIYLPLIYSGFLLSGGGGRKKAGKQVIRSTGLSIEVGVGGT